MISLTLPYPPTVNTYWRVSHGRFYIAQKGVNFRNEVLARAMQQKLQNKLTGRLKVEVIATMPDNRIRDLDNLNKAILDSLSYSKVIEDDKYIDDLRIVRGGIDKNNSRVDVYISEIN